MQPWAFALAAPSSAWFELDRAAWVLPNIGDRCRVGDNDDHGGLADHRVLPWAYRPRNTWVWPPPWRGGSVNPPGRGRWWLGFLGRTPWECPAASPDPVRFSSRNGRAEMGRALETAAALWRCPHPLWHHGRAGQVAKGPLLTVRNHPIQEPTMRCTATFLVPALLLAVSFSACTSTEESSDQARASQPPQTQPRDVGVREASVEKPPVEPVPWTDAFMTPAVLVAKNIIVEGPPGLVAHAAMTADETRYIIKHQTTERGFEQSAKAKPSVGREVRCQLDQWVLAAESSVIVIESTKDRPVVIRGEGGAFWRDVNGNVQRGEELEFVGELPK